MSTVEALEKQIQQLKIDEILKQLNISLERYKKKYENKAFARFVKSSRQQYLHIIWFKEFFIHQDYYKEYKIVYTEQSIFISKNKWRTDTELTFRDKTKKGEHEDYRNPDEVIREWGCQVKEISLKEFEDLKKIIKVFNQSLLNNFFDTQTINYNCDLNGNDYDEFRGDERTIKLLDIPHLRLSGEEAFLLSKSVFMRNNNYLLSPNSIKLAIDTLNNKIKEENKSLSLSYEFGYRYKDKIQECKDLIKKFEKCK